MRAGISAKQWETLEDYKDLCGVAVNQQVSEAVNEYIEVVVGARIDVLAERAAQA